MGFGAAWREHCDGEADHEGVWACGAGTVWDLFSLSWLVSMTLHGPRRIRREY